MGGHDGSYDTWHAEERDDDDDETTRQQFSAVVHPPHTFAHGQHKPFGYPPHSDIMIAMIVMTTTTVAAAAAPSWTPDFNVDGITHGLPPRQVADKSSQPMKLHHDGDESND